MLLEGYCIQRWGGRSVDGKEEPINFPDSIYFIIVTISTIGFGDITPYSSGFKLCFLILNIPVIGLFGVFVLDIGKEFDRLVMYIINCIIMYITLMYNYLVNFDLI